MGKKKGGKRLGKKQVSELLQNLFQHNPNETFTFKQIFKALKLDTHPLKMLAIDVMEEMAWDDFLSKVSDNSYRLNLKTQVQEGVFRRKANGRNSFLPDDGGTPVFVAERNSMSALDGDRVKVSYMARRDKHIKEAMVIEIVKRAHDQIVGKPACGERYGLPRTARQHFRARHHHSQAQVERRQDRRQGGGQGGAVARQ